MIQMWVLQKILSIAVSYDICCLFVVVVVVVVVVVFFFVLL